MLWAVALLGILTKEKTRTDKKCASAQNDQAKGDNPPVGMRRHAVFRVSRQPALDQYATGAQHQTKARDGAQYLERRLADGVALHALILRPFPTLSGFGNTAPSVRGIATTEAETTVP